MAQTINLRSESQILGDLVRAILAETDLNALEPGSDLATLLEAIALSQYEIEVSALKILENSNLESLTGNNLDKKAESVRIPNNVGGVGRKPSVQAIGPVNISDSSFSKITSKPYAGKPSPFAGSTILYVEDGQQFLDYLTANGSGSLYIGRGTIDRFEGPIPFTSVTNSGSFWIIQLSTPLSKSHLISEEVTLAQGGDRSVSAGTSVQVPGNNEQSPVIYTTNESLLIPDGEDNGTVNVTCTQFGIIGNALLNTIVEFQTAPFTGAQVTNPTTFRSGKSSESDEDLRQRIKAYPATLSRGTSNAILGAILGATDAATGRTVQSASLLNPVEPGDAARVFIDDGTGLEPALDGQAYELLISDATGQETRFAASQTPITAASVIGANSGPFILNTTMTMTIRIDDIFEDFVINLNNYKNINSSSGYEIARDLNSQTNLIAFRTLDSGKRIIATDLSGKSERLQVLSSDLQEVLGLPLYISRPMYLYKNSQLLSFKGKTATLQTRPKNLWTSITPADFQDIQVLVDGVTETFSVDDADFTSFGTTVATGTITQWVEVLQKKIAGVKFVVSGQVIVWQTWQQNSATGSLEILELDANGNPAGWVSDSKVWTTVASGGTLKDEGSGKDYSLNRFTGEITLVNKPEEGSKLEIATRSTRAFVNSIKTTNGLYTLSPLASVGNARLVLSFDGLSVIRSVDFLAGSTITPSEPDPVNAKNIIRLTANNTNVWSQTLVGDWLYLIKDADALNTWGSKVEGFYRVKVKGINNIDTGVTYSSPLLSGSTNGATGLTLTTTIGTNQVIVTYNGHGLKSGDKATVTSGVTVGGISSGNLTVSNATITYIDANNFYYNASAFANINDTVTSPSISAYTNLITVTLASHPFTTGNIANLTSTTALGGITSGNLTVAGAEITVVSANTIQYKALTAASSISVGSFFSVVSIPSTWVEFEVSSDQFTDWSPLLGNAQTLTDKMVNVFKSTSMPQLVDFGNSVSTLTVDQVVDAINSQVVSGIATKINPQQFTINSLCYDENASIASVLASIGNASTVIGAAVASGQQSHTANSISQEVQSGSLITQGNNFVSFGKTTTANGYPTREYLKFDKTFTNLTDELSNPTITTPASLVTSYPTGFQHLWISGREYGVNTRVYNNQTTSPYNGFARGEEMINPLNTSDTIQTNTNSLDRYSNFGLKFRDLPLNNSDKFVVELDLDSTNKTIAIQMAKTAKILDINAIAGAGKGQVISFRLKDPDNADLNFFDNTSVYKDFNFEDFKLLTKSVGVYKTTGADRALIIRSKDFGGQSRVTFSILYPTLQDQPNIVVSHSTEYVNGIAQLNVTAALPSQAAVPTASYLNSIYQIKSTANGNIFNWRISAGSLGSNPGLTVGRILNIGNNGGLTGIDGSFLITASSYISLASVFASTTNGSPIITCTSAAHGLVDGALISVVSAVAIGGIPAVNITQTNIPVTVIDANSFSFVALSNAVGGTGSISTVTQGVVTVSSPSSGGFASPSNLNAVFNPITVFPLVDTTLTQIATALNNYLPDNPVVSGEAIGSTLSTSYVTNATYIDNSLTPAYSQVDVSGGVAYHFFSCKYTNGAGIWQYDSSNISLNEIKATVQNDDSIFPTTTDASGTSYSPINEEVLIVPTNTKTLASWVNFKAASSLNVIASADRVTSDQKLQIATKADGSDGAVKVTGVNANKVLTAVVGNAETSSDAIKLQVASADAKSLVPGSLVRIKNTLPTEIKRPYRYTPTGAEITAANTEDTDTYLRETNGVQYVRVSATSGRFIFRRNGLNISQVEPIYVNNEITFTSLGSGLVQVSIAQGTGLLPGTLSARVGDMMYIPKNTFPDDKWCKTPILTNGVTLGNNPEYLGYPVVRVVDSTNIVVIAPNVSTSGPHTVAAPTDLVFIPAIWNEKNVRTSYKEGSKFFLPYNNNTMHYFVKKLNANMAMIVVQNSATQATDTMELEKMSVNSDDYAVFGNGFAAANQGTFKIVGYGADNQIVVYNPLAVDEMIEANSTENGGYGSRKWRVGPIQTPTRPIRIISSESVRVGDYLRISSPADSLNTYFSSDFFGAWQITGIGLHAYTYTGPAPYTIGSGSVDLTKLTPYVDVTFPNGAPEIIATGIGEFTLDSNAPSMGFIEQEPMEVYRLVAGSAVNATNIENGDVFLVPQAQSTKMSQVFGTTVESLNKIGFELKTFQGIDGYKYYTEILQTTQSIIDGKPSNTTVYPGVKAAGSTIEVLTPLIKSVSVSLTVKPRDGVTLNSISDLVKSAVAGYVNGLGVGQPVVISQIVRVVQGLPGVFSVSIVSTSPVINSDRIVVSSQEKAFVLDVNDVVVG